MLLHKRIPLDITTTIGGQNCCRTLSSNWVHRGSKQSVPLPSSLPHSKLECLLFITGSSYRGTILHGPGGGGKA